MTHQTPPQTPQTNPMPPWVQTQLNTLVNKPGHALLLTGPAGLNQFDLALALAGAWLCDQPDGHSLACGVCDSCHMFHAHTHPDLKVLLPENLAIELGWDAQDQSSTAEDGKRKASREIRAEALRSMINFSQRTRSRSKVQVVVIYPAERMNAVSANTVLKTLEEPPGELRFILASENAQRLLSTIRSRCQNHSMLWPTPQDALEWLQSQGVEKPEVMLAAAGGRPEQALQLLQQGLSAQSWAHIPQALGQGDITVFEGMTTAQMLDVASKLCHDLLSLNAGAQPRFFSKHSLPKQTKEKAVLAWSKELMQATRVVEHPWNLPLYTQALVATAQRILQP